LLTPFFFTALIYYEAGKEYYRWTAFGLFLTATLTDALDGFLARVTRKRTELGRFLDPLADKLLLLSGFLGILLVDALIYRPPLWVTVTIVFRDMVILTGLIVIYLISGRIRVQPNFLGKVTTASQMATLIAILLQWAVSIPLSYFTAGFTILSCLAYIVRDLRRLNIPT
jgi:CDP-diacylglycerol--glycerol-3-phosphate 3-phosphatidyltransferase